MPCKSIRAVVLDVDGVVVPIKSSWQHVHEALGTYEVTRLHEKLYTSGRIGYWEWMYLDTLSWLEARPGITRWELERILSVEIPREIIDWVRRLRRCGLRVALLSGGIDLLVARIASILGVDAWESPRLEFDPWGRLVPGGYPSVVAGRKSETLRRLLARLGVDLSETVYIGDSRWDVDAMKECCMSIAVEPADEEARSVADYVATSVVDALSYVARRAGCCETG